MVDSSRLENKTPSHIFQGEPQLLSPRTSSSICVVGSDIKKARKQRFLEECKLLSHSSFQQGGNRVLSAVIYADGSKDKVCRGINIHPDGEY